jgi:DNA primase
MLEAGLVSYNREKNRYYDKFRNRVIFPIFNTGGKVIGFGGRDLGNNGPKYLNSPESSVFSKKNNLYGLNITRQDINNSNCAIMVEGYMDLVSLYKNGVTNVAASLGTALTENQCQLLKRYTENVVLAYDADAAGQKAALRGIELLHSAGIKAKVLHISDGKDPDEFIKKHGKQAFLKLVDEALPYAEYRISVIRNRHDLSSSEGIIDFLKDVKPVLTSLSPVETDVYIKKLAAETEISESAIRREINSDVMHAADASFTRKDVSSYDNSETVGNAVLQKNLIRLISVNAEYISRIREYESVFTDPVYYRIYNAMRSLHDDGMIDLKKAADVLEPEDVGVFDDIIRSQPFPVNSDQMLEDLIRKMKTDRLNDRYNDIIQMLDVLPENENEQIEALSQELMMIQSELQNTKQ